MTALGTRLAWAGFGATDVSPENDTRRALLDDLRRRIERLEQRPPAPTGPRLPPGELHSVEVAAGGPDAPSSVGRLCCSWAPSLQTALAARGSVRTPRRLIDLDGAEPTDWGAWFRVAAEPRQYEVRELRRAPVIIAARLAGLAHEPPTLLDELRILDIETTGLSGGTGTIAFLVGVGRFVEERLLVEQLLLRAPGDEPRLLDALLEVLGGGTLLVTFNGRTFDGPLLRTRCILARRAPGALATLPHLDVLPVARRLWRERTGDCRLITLEERILGRRRVEDVPGAMAPLAYTTFLRTGDASALAAIVLHNREDIIGTAALLAAALRILAAPLEWAEEACELHAAAEHRLRHEGPGAALPILIRAVALARAPALRRRLLADLARLERRTGDGDGAETTWRRYRDEFPNENRGFVELAKALEHRRRDPRAALAEIERAPHRGAVDVQHRRDRLTRRVGRAAGN